MSMKNLLILFLGLSSVLWISSCDKIEGPYIEQNTLVATCDTPTFTQLTNPIQKIFLEEYTGQTCVNCPQGHKTAATLKTRYEDTMVLMAIHAGIFAEPEAAPSIFTADYRSEAGNQLNSFFGVQGYPSGIVNRTPFMGMTVLDKSAWSSAINALDRTSPTLAIQLEAVDNSAENGFCVFVKSTFLQNTLKNYKLTLFLIEDSIVSPQKNNLASIGPVPDITDYIHRHMLRTSINSVWGDAISTITTQSAANSFVIKGYSFSFSGKPYVKSRCSVIAVVYDSDTKAVVQVEETHLPH